MTALTHRLDVYDVELFLATTKREWATLRRRLTFLETTEGYSGLTTWAVRESKDGGLPVPHLAFWIDVAKHRDPGDLVDTCAHEASHGAGRILENAAHDLPHTDEPHAYLVGWLTRWLWTGCNERRAA